MEPRDARRRTCYAHYLRMYRTGSYGSPQIRPHRGDRQEEVCYSAAHHRVYRTRGPAREQVCVDCGSAAEEWSYDGGAPDEQTDANTWDGRAVALTWSGDPSFYSPRCRTCHRIQDHHKERPQRANAEAVFTNNHHTPERG